MEKQILYWEVHFFLFLSYYLYYSQMITLINDNIIDGSLDSFVKNTVSIGKDLAISLNY